MKNGKKSLIAVLLSRIVVMFTLDHNGWSFIKDLWIYMKLKWKKRNPSTM